MNDTNKNERFEELYTLYYTIICEELLGHSFEKLKKPSYHKKDFIDQLEDEALSIKINEGY
jgi:hypothetical protein